MATITTSPPSSPPSSYSSIGVTTEIVARLQVTKYAEHPASKILFAFLDHSPPDSVQVIAKDIIDHPDLQALADHYFSAILLPSMLHKPQPVNTLATLDISLRFLSLFLVFIR